MITTVYVVLRLEVVYLLGDWLGPQPVEGFRGTKVSIRAQLRWVAHVKHKKTCVKARY